MKLERYLDCNTRCYQQKSSRIDAWLVGGLFPICSTACYSMGWYIYECCRGLLFILQSANGISDLNPQIVSMCFCRGLDQICLLPVCLLKWMNTILINKKLRNIDFFQQICIVLNLWYFYNSTWIIRSKFYIQVALKKHIYQNLLHVEWLYSLLRCESQRVVYFSWALNDIHFV